MAIRNAHYLPQRGKDHDWDRTKGQGQTDEGENEEWCTKCSYYSQLYDSLNEFEYQPVAAVYSRGDHSMSSPCSIVLEESGDFMPHQSRLIISHSRSTVVRKSRKGNQILDLPTKVKW